MNTPLTLALGLCTATTTLAASNEEAQPKKADTPLIAHPFDATETMAEDVTLDPYIPSLTLRDGMSVTFGGRLMFDTSLIDADDTHPSGEADGSEFRRSRIFAKIKVSDHVSAKAQYDFAGGEVGIRDLYIKFKTERGAFTVGHHYQPISIEELTSSRYITFLERAMVVEALSPGRDTGISTSNKFGENTTWALGLFRPVDGTGDGSGDGDYSLTGRLAHSIERGDSTFHMGASTSLSSSRDLRVRSRPEVHQTGRVVDTGTGSSDKSMLVGLEFAWTNGPNTVQAEYIMTSIDDFDTGGGAEDVDFMGYYISIARRLTGESQPYNKAGKWGRVKPTQNWEGKGVNGAWEAAARYSMLDLTDGATNEEATGITVGLNWYMNPNTRLMFNIVRSEADISGVDSDFTALIARFQVDW